MKQLYILRTYIKFNNLEIPSMYSDEDLKRARYKPLTDLLNKGNSGVQNSFSKRYLNGGFFLHSDDENLICVGNEKEMQKYMDKELVSEDSADERIIQQCQNKNNNYTPIRSNNNQEDIIYKRNKKNSSEEDIYTLIGKRDDDEFSPKKIAYVPKYNAKKKKNDFRTNSNYNGSNNQLGSYYHEFDDNKFLEQISSINNFEKNKNLEIKLNNNDPKNKPSDCELINLSNINLRDCPKPIDLYDTDKIIDPDWSLETKDLENGETTAKKKKWTPFRKVSSHINYPKMNKQLYSNKKEDFIDEDSIKFNSKSNRDNNKIVKYKEIECSEKDSESVGNELMNEGGKNAPDKIYVEENDEDTFSKDFENSFSNHKNEFEKENQNKDFKINTSQKNKSESPEKNIKKESESDNADGDVDEDEFEIEFKFENNEKDELVISEKEDIQLDLHDEESEKNFLLNLNILKELKETSSNILGLMPEACQQICEMDQDELGQKYISTENREFLIEYIQGVIEDIKDKEEESFNRLKQI